MREFDRKINLSKEYINEAKKHRKTTNGEGVLDEATCWGHNEFDQDEDMMADI